jgi:hypothetical protein
MNRLAGAGLLSGFDPPSRLTTRPFYSRSSHLATACLPLFLGSDGSNPVVYLFSESSSS